MVSEPGLSLNWFRAGLEGSHVWRVDHVCAVDTPTLLPSVRLASLHELPAFRWPDVQACD